MKCRNVPFFTRQFFLLKYRKDQLRALTWCVSTALNGTRACGVPSRGVTSYQPVRGRWSTLRQILAASRWRRSTLREATGAQRTKREDRRDGSGQLLCLKGPCEWVLVFRKVEEPTLALLNASYDASLFLAACLLCVSPPRIALCAKRAILHHLPTPARGARRRDARGWWLPPPPPRLLRLLPW